MGDDVTLIHRIAEGDREAFKQIFKRYAERVFRYAMSQLKHRELAEEATQETMLALWIEAKGFKGLTKASTWIFGIAHHKVSDKLKEEGRWREEVVEAGDQLPSLRPGPERQAQQEFFADRVRSALQKLSSEHRAVVMLTFYQGLSYSNIAQILNCPEGTVKSRMHYAKEKLRELLGGDQP